MTTDLQDDDLTFRQSYEYALIDQNDGSIVRGPVTEQRRNDLFDGLQQVMWELKGHHAWFYLSDKDQKFPMICRRRTVHTYRGSWS